MANGEFLQLLEGSRSPEGTIWVRNRGQSWHCKLAASGQGRMLLKGCYR